MNPRRQDSRGAPNGNSEQARDAVRVPKDCAKCGRGLVTGEGHVCDVAPDDPNWPRCIAIGCAEPACWQSIRKGTPPRCEQHEPKRATHGAGDSSRDDRDEGPALKRIEQVRPPPPPGGAVTCTLQPLPLKSWSSPTEWLKARLCGVQAALAALWTDPSASKSAAERADLLTVRRIVKATLLALVRGDKIGLRRLNNAAATVLKDSLNGPITPSEQRYEHRPQASLLKGEDGTQVVVRYGDVPDDESFGWQIGGARVSEGRGAMARSFAEQVEVAHGFYADDDQAFADWLVGRPWTSASDRWWPEFSAMHNGAIVVDQAAIARGDAPLFDTPRDKTFELQEEEFAEFRARLRDEVREWQLDLVGRDEEPRTADFEALVRKGFKALGANEQAVDNLFKAAKQKARRNRIATQIEAEPTDSAVLASSRRRA
jgi:hypothetical protein